MRAPRLTLRRRVALWCTGLVVVSGSVVVLIVVVSAGNLLHDRARVANQASRQDLPPGAPGEAAPGSGPGAGAGQGGRPDPTVIRAQDDARRAAADETFDDVRVIGFAAVAGLAVVAVGTSWIVSGHLIRPLAKVTETARSITHDSRLDRRIGYDGAGDEIDELAGSFDGMLDRLEAVFEAQRSFVSNTSHELRTPIAAMRAEVDVALDHEGADAAELRRSLVAVREELDHTTGLVSSMLSLARAEAITDPQPYDLADAAERATAALDPAFRAQHDVRVDLAPAPVTGDPVLLAQLLANLVGNACKYQRLAGLLSVRTGTDGAESYVVVENDGPQVDPATLGSLFARFVRRSEQGEGYGLGLAIVHTIVETHGGTVGATARLQGGLRVEVRLPARRA